MNSLARRFADFILDIFAGVCFWAVSRCEWIAKKVFGLEHPDDLDYTP